MTPIDKMKTSDDQTKKTNTEEDENCKCNMVILSKARHHYGNKITNNYNIVNNITHIQCGKKKPLKINIEDEDPKTAANDAGAMPNAPT